MADVIKSDIEKIERALNIRVEDVEIEVALNAGKYSIILHMNILYYDFSISSNDFQNSRRTAS